MTALQIAEAYAGRPAWAAVRERRAELEALRAQNVPAPWWVRRKS